MTEPRKLTRKQVQKVLVEFDMAGKLEALMTQLEARGLVWRRPEGPLPWGCPAAANRDFVVLTLVGMLGVTKVYPPRDGDSGDTIFCVWDDPSNRYVPYGVSQNGKWNHHAFAGYVHSPTSREEVLKRLNDTWRSFCRQMEFHCPADGA